MTENVIPNLFKLFSSTEQNEELEYVVAKTHGQKENLAQCSHK